MTSASAVGASLAVAPFGRTEIFIAYEIDRYPQSHRTIKRLRNLVRSTSQKVRFDVFTEDAMSL
jgi:hypothetical protein